MRAHSVDPSHTIPSHPNHPPYRELGGSDGPWRKLPRRSPTQRADEIVVHELVPPPVALRGRRSGIGGNACWWGGNTTQQPVQSNRIEPDRQTKIGHVVRPFVVASRELTKYLNDVSKLRCCAFCCLLFFCVYRLCTHGVSEEFFFSIKSCFFLSQTFTLVVHPRQGFL